MEKTVVTSAICGNAFQSANGDLFPSHYTFSDGTCGEAFGKAQTPRFGAGEVVDVELKGTKTRDGVDRIKIQKPQGNFGGQSFSAPPASGGAPASKPRVCGEQIGNCMTNAVNLCCHGKAELKDLKMLVKRLIAIGTEVDAEANKPAPPPAQDYSDVAGPDAGPVVQYEDVPEDDGSLPF